MNQKVLSQRELFLSSQFSNQIQNYRLFYFLILLYIFLQAYVIQFGVESRMFEMFCFLSLSVVFFYCLNKPNIALMVFTIYIPFSKYIVGSLGTGVNFTNILVITIISGWFVSHEYREEKFFVATPINLPLILFALVGLMSVIQGSYQLKHFENKNLIIMFWQWILPFFAFFLAVNNIEDRKSIKTVIKLVIITTFIVSLMAIRTHLDIGGKSFEDSRVASIAGNPNALGVFFVNFAPIILGVYVYNKKKLLNWVLIIIYLLCSRGVQVTQSRGAWLGYAVSAIFITLIGRSRKLILLGLLALSIFVVKPEMIPETIVKRFQSTFTNKNSYIERPVEETVEKSASDRIVIWKGALKIIQSHPFFGLGYGTFPYFIRDYTETEPGASDAHNSYLLIAAQMGIPALIIFLSLMFTAFYIVFDVFRKAKDKFIKGAALGFSASVVGLLVTSMFGSRMNSLELIGQFWIMVGVMQRMRMIIKKEKEQEKKLDVGNSGFADEH